MLFSNSAVSLIHVKQSGLIAFEAAMIDVQLIDFPSHGLFSPEGVFWDCWAIAEKRVVLVIDWIFFYFVAFCWRVEDGGLKIVFFPVAMVIILKSSLFVDLSAVHLLFGDGVFYIV